MMRLSIHLNIALTNMRNLTEYNDLFILNLIKQVKGNPYKCTANVQYAVEGNHLIPVLVIYQDNSKDWDIDDAVLFCERTEAVDFCDESMSIGDLFDMIEYYTKISFQANVNDIEYETECEEYDEQYHQALQEELSWYLKARQMGWE